MRDFWRLLLIGCMVVLIIYSLATAIYSENQKREYCISACDSFGKSMQEIRNSVCICDESLEIPIFDFKAYNSLLTSS